MIEKLSVTLPSEMVEFAKRRVDAGAFASTSEVLREAMRLWMRQEEEHEARLAALKAKVAAAIADPRPRLTIEEIRKRLDDTRASRLAG